MFILLTLGLALVGWVGVGREGLKDTSVIAYSVKSRKTLRVDKKRTVWYKNKYAMYYSKLRELNLFFSAYQRFVIFRQERGLEEGMQ